MDYIIHARDHPDCRRRNAGIPVGDSKVMTEEERAVLVDYLAYNPAAGDLIQGTGGVRKLRWGLEERGKRGGARVIYFFHSASTPLFVLTAYAKNEKADLSQKDRNDFRQVTELLAKTYGRTQRK
jgi:hypothetical protein